MKIKFDSELEYQNEAINSVVDIFEGQEICQSNFTVATMNDNLFTMTNDLGIGNRLELLDDEILQNIQNIQLRNGLPQSDKIGSMDFSVEMETGTGKTYVYLKSIFEMNRKYGFTKFIIVVPSVAIKEGANKTLEMTNEHFKNIFDNVKYDYFIYDNKVKGNLEKLRDFATSSDIRIMIINIDSFRKDMGNAKTGNLIHRTDIDRLNGYKPIDFITTTNPIVIIDEPQSVDNTPKSKEAISTLNPLCKLRYSATHTEKYNLMYKLDSIDAYEKKLVKQIEVANVRTTDNSNQAYIKLLSVKANPRSAKVEVVSNKNGTSKIDTLTIKDNSDLYELTNRDVYENFIVNDIYIEEENEYVMFSNGMSLAIGEAIGDVDEDTIKRLQIRKTIEEHLDKEKKLNPKGIKVLSLFFIDKVANYRSYDEEGNVLKGKFAHWFEEEYKTVIKYPKYKSLFEGVKDLDTEVEKIHDGYFSQDKKGKVKDSNENAKGELKSNKDDEDTFSRIMKNKEKLLSFEDPLRFIFSHSALKEGWDNPNVFQICTLKEGTKSEIRRRQEIGRGLRICVNQDGERVYGFDTNTLTVMANETYEDFARGLQKEIEKEEGIKFGVIENHEFANITIKDEDGNISYLGANKSEDIHNYLLDMKYIDKKGKVQDSLKLDLHENKFEVPQEFEDIKTQIVSVIKKISGKLNIKNADDKVQVKVNKQVLLSEEFKQLWEQIKYKSTYRVDFDEDKLVEECAKNIQNELRVNKIKYIYSKATNKITKVGVEIDEETLLKDKYVDCEIIDYKLPDIITYLQNETNLTRRNIVDILTKSEKLKDFKNNPQKFIDKAVEIIKKTMNVFIVDGIKYQKLGEEYYYAQESFESEELSGYLKKNMYQTKNEKSPYEYTVYDSDVERTFAVDFDNNPDVKLFTKLPNWFKINTPLGRYNPDWAVLIEKENNEERLYFVVESKGNLFGMDLRDSEAAKIECGKRHFKGIGSDAQLVQSNNFKNFMEEYL